jgi:hypothetical protein
MAPGSVPTTGASSRPPTDTVVGPVAPVVPLPVTPTGHSTVVSLLASFNFGEYKYINLREEIGTHYAFCMFESVQVTSVSVQLVLTRAGAGFATASIISRKNPEYAKYMCSPFSAVLPYTEALPGVLTLHYDGGGNFDPEIKKINVGNPAPRILATAEGFPSNLAGQLAANVIVRVGVVCSGSAPPIGA